MKCSIIVATMACVLSVTLASNDYKVDKAHWEVLAYAHDNMAAVPFIKGSSGHLACYNGFLPLINSLALKARAVSQKCVDDHSKLTDGHWSDLKLQRSKIASEVEKIRGALADCDKKQGLDYFNCLAGNAEGIRQKMEDIKMKSKDIVLAHEDKISKTELAEENCLLNAVDAAKAESDQAFVNLRSCIKYGGPKTDASSTPEALSTCEDSSTPENSEESSTLEDVGSTSTSADLSEEY